MFKKSSCLLVAGIVVLFVGCSSMRQSVNGYYDKAKNFIASDNKKNSKTGVAEIKSKPASAESVDSSVDSNDKLNLNKQSDDTVKTENVKKSAMDSSLNNAKSMAVSGDEISGNVGGNVKNNVNPGKGLSPDVMDNKIVTAEQAEKKDHTLEKPNDKVAGDQPVENKTIQKVASSESVKTAVVTAEPVLSTSKTVHIPLRKLKFSPAKVVIKEGETVTWINDSKRKHNFISITKAGESTDDAEIFHLAPPGDQWSYTFYDAGNYPYYCFIHSRMKGEIVVLPAD